MSDIKTIHVVTDGKIADGYLVPASATIAADGRSASWDDTTLDAPSGSTFAAIDGGVIGWGWDGKVLTAPPPPSAPPVDLPVYAQSAWTAFLAKGQTFNVAAQGQDAVEVLCDGTNDTRADLALLALYGQANPSGTKTWLDNTGKTTSLTGTQLVILATAAGNWVSDTYPALGALLGEIASGSVATTAAIDAYAWPTT